MEDKYTFQFYTDIANFIKSKLPNSKPTILIICGSGLGTLAEAVENPTIIKYKDIPNFPISTVEGQASQLVIGKLSNVEVACMQGRFHYYEGYETKDIALPVRVMKLLGVQTMIVTNAAGGINPTFQIGDIMLLKDHINFLGMGGQNPMRGRNIDEFGSRFFAINKTYDSALRDKFRQTAADLGFENLVREGVYALYCGPNYESIAEIKFLETAGADATGMSTVPEVLTAAQCGIKVLGFSLITNICIKDYNDDHEPNHDEVLEVVKERSEQLKQIVSKLVPNL